MINRLSAIFVLACMLAPGQVVAQQTPTLQDFAGRLAAREGLTTIYVARTFLTMDPNKPRAEAIAVRGGEFVAVGTRAECEAAAGKDAKVDSTFEGKVVIAGFVEQHVHPVLAALTMNTKVISIEDWDAIDGFSPAVREEAGYRERLREALAGHKDNKTPFVTWGYHHYFHGAMSRETLNRMAPDVPVIVWHRSAHEVFLNDAALKLTGIDEALIKGLGESARAQASLPEGHFYEQGMLAIHPRVAPYMASAEQFREGLEFSKTYYHRNGITLACEPGGFVSKPMQDAINAAYSDDATPFNHYFIGDGKSFFAIKPNDAASLLAETRKVEGWGKGRTAYLANQVKLFTDGAIYSQLMQMKGGYTDGHHGAWIVDPPSFDFMFQTYWDAGYQIHIHNNGDAGLDVVLSSIEEAMRRKPRKDHRTVLVHFGFAQPEQVRRWGELGGIVSSNPYYVTALAGRYAKLGIGPERSRNMVPMGDVVENGVSFSFHSDMPMAPAKPLQLVWAAVNRLTAEGEVAGPEHRVTLDQALKAVTLDAAYSVRMEGRVGSITVGKDANLTVLEQDPYEVHPAKIKDIPVWGTMLEGRLQPVAAATRAAAAPRGRGPGLADTVSDLRVEHAAIEQLARLIGYTCSD
ncbi:N-substituted formamide deformylase precursor [Aquisphaera giovannonii]|uniref:N-substituted formamide deformylase n=1 Tax=Aquisphaera giovannonii TaxID=406548 RepID=A0A5B9W4D5_9BACT|nr:amidohydrolase [Aquisphaera giovannonii]QEH35486.1 N-substituted formamide deformylase precursor [Aquisphaera giovannonii]